MQERTIRTFSLVFLITGAIDSIRNLPSMALFGDSLVFFFCLASLLFLVPVALISASLSATWPEQGGIYAWVKLAFGEKIAFLAIWLQWVNTLIWLPTILSFLAGTSAYLIDPALSTNKFYLIFVICILNALLTWVNLKGIRVSANISTICAIIGTMLPIGFILVLGLIWFSGNHPLQIHFSTEHLLPNLSETTSWLSLTAIVTSFLGVELASVHIREVHEPQRAFPRALAISVVLVISTIFFGALAIAFVLPKEKISLVNGIADTFSFFLQSFNLVWLLPYIIIMMLIGSFGGMISWIISPTKGLLQAVAKGFLPAFFAKQNANGAPVNLLIIQSLLTSILSLGFLIVPSINSIYWFLTDLSTELYVLMYVLMFIAALTLMNKALTMPGTFKIPGGRIGYVLVCLLGLIGCIIALIIGFLPPGNNNISSHLPYQMIFGLTLGIMISPVVIFYLYHFLQTRYQSNNLSPDESSLAVVPRLVPGLQHTKIQRDEIA